MGGRGEERRGWGSTGRATRETRLERREMTEEMTRDIRTNIEHGSVCEDEVRRE
jgi:hypothetical protein